MVIKNSWERLIPFIGDNKFGYKNIQDGKVVIQPQFERVGEFTDGYAVVGESPNVGVIDSEGNVVIPLAQTEVVIVRGGIFQLFDEDSSSVLWMDGEVYDFEYILDAAHLMSNGKHGLYDMEERRFIVPCEYDDLHIIEDVILVMKDGKIGYLDKNGQVISPCVYDVYQDYWSEMNDHINDSFIIVEKDGLIGIIGRDGKELQPCCFDGLTDAGDNIVLLGKGDETFMYNVESDNLFSYDYDNAAEWRNGFAIVQKNGKYGLVDDMLNVVIPTIYDDFKLNISGFLRNMCPVLLDGHWGMVCSDGKEILPAVYDEQPGFISDKYFMVSHGGKKGVATSEGEQIVPCLYDHIQKVSPGFLVLQSGKYGILSSQGEEITKCCYDKLKWIHEFDSKVGLVEVESDGLHGLLDRSGREIVPCLYDKVEASELQVELYAGDKVFRCDRDGSNLEERTIHVDRTVYTAEGEFFVINYSGKSGLVDIRGKEIIPCEYSYIGEVNGALILTANNDGIMIIYNRQGDVLFRNIQDIASFIDGLGFIKDEKGWSLIDRSGLMVKDHVCDEIVWSNDYVDESGEVYPMDDLSRDKWKFIKGGKHGFVDESGNVVVPFEYDSVERTEDGFCVSKNGRHGFLDTTGACVVPLESEFGVVAFSNNLWMVTRNGVECVQDRWGCIMPWGPNERREEICGTDEFVKVTSEGKYGWSHVSDGAIVPCIYDDVDPETGDSTTLFLKENCFVDIFLSGKWGIATIRDGRVIVEPVYDERVSAYGDVERFVLRKDDKFAFADFCGQVIIDFIYDFIGDFCCSLAEARLDEKYGFIDKDGQKVVPLEYDGAYDFNEDIAEVVKDGLFGFVNTKGEIVADCIYTDAYYCIEGLARVENEDGYGFINAKGEQVIPCQFTYAEDFHDGKAIVSVKGRPGFWYIDKKGQIISEI